MESENKIISWSSCEGLSKKINVKSLAVSLVLLASGLYVSLALDIADPKSNLNMLRLFGGWIVVAAGVCGLLFRLRHWVYEPTGSAVGHRSVVFGAEKLPALRRLLAEYAGGGDLRTGDSGSVYVDCYVSADSNYIAYQVLQYGTFGDSPLTPVNCLSGARAQTFIEALGK